MRAQTSAGQSQIDRPIHRPIPPKKANPRSAGDNTPRERRLACEAHAASTSCAFVRIPRSRLWHCNDNLVVPEKQLHLADCTYTPRDRVQLGSTLVVCDQPLSKPQDEAKDRNEEEKDAKRRCCEPAASRRAVDAVAIVNVIRVVVAHLRNEQRSTSRRKSATFAYMSLTPRTTYCSILSQLTWHKGPPSPGAQ